MKRTLAMLSLALMVSCATAASAADLKAGADIYRAKCLSCHGKNGNGDTPVARNFNPPPPDFTKGEYRHGGTEADITKSITMGIPSTAMSGWKGRLTSAEIASVVAYLQSLKK